MPRGPGIAALVAACCGLPALACEGDGRCEQTPPLVDAALDGDLLPIDGEPLLLAPSDDGASGRRR